ncbi:TetR/AcrR family transcriptional regulator [Pontitalea aquivivens]|uniref:TetR/AcrR family transcriptional regulator n=1 Tax=Pontitalea aquivivens TaxID=3388663 RepID=UPI003970ED4B
MSQPQPAPILSFRDEVAALKRQRILNAAADLFYSHGYSNTTLDAVGEQLGFSKAFVYANFGSKQQLLAEICERGVTGVHEEVAHALSMGLETGATLSVLMDRYVNAVLEYQKFIAVYVREEKSLLDADADRISLLRRTFFATIADFIAKGTREGVFQTTDPLMSALTLGGAVTWTTFWYRENGRLERKAIAREITRNVNRMLGVTPGGRT